MQNAIIDKDRSAGRFVGELSRAAHVYFKSHFNDYSIGHAQVRTLHFIAHNDGITQIELANHLNLDKSSITSQLKILEGNAYVLRKISKSDARIHQIFITDKTRAILEPLHNVFLEWTQILLAGFSETESDEAFRLLEKMSINARNEIESLKKQKNSISFKVKAFNEKKE